ncbi:shootin-1-like protein [Lates japonicus]|uniref:Shootin-1-like protein n=1 Tax=Lates japonicus TaxID=270547 RepID=A0AAD3RHV0_LATJO|nr:shootin-1-like protein [Lates japonicus]
MTHQHGSPSPELVAWAPPPHSLLLLLPPPPPPPPSRDATSAMRVWTTGRQGVNEMMERIKQGRLMAHKSQDSKQPPVCEEKQQESAMDELKGILDTVKRSPSRGSQESGPSPPGKKDSELEVILRRRRNKAGEAGSADEREGQMIHVSSSDSLNGRRTSSDSGKDLSVPSDPAGPRVSLERRGSGPGPIVARRKSSDTGGREPRVGSWQERRSCSSLSEKETAESPVSNGCIDSVLEDDQNVMEKCIQSNGVDHAEPGEEAHAAVCTGSGDAEC